MGHSNWEEAAEDLGLLLLLSPCRQEEWVFSAAVDSCVPLLRHKSVQTPGPWCCHDALQYNCLIVTSKQLSPRVGDGYVHYLMYLGLLLIIQVLVTDRSKQNAPGMFSSLPVLHAAFYTH